MGSRLVPRILAVLFEGPALVSVALVSGPATNCSRSARSKAHARRRRSSLCDVRPLTLSLLPLDGEMDSKMNHCSTSPAGGGERLSTGRVSGPVLPEDQGAGGGVDRLLW